MKREYGGAVWTNHALQRLSERGISQGDAWATFNRPHSSKKASTKGAYVYYRTFGDTRIEVVAKKSEDKWIIMSVWSRKVYKEKKKRKVGLLHLVKKLLAGKST